MREAPSARPAEPVPARSAGAAPAGMAEAVAWAESGRRLAAAQGRADLTARLDSLRAQLADQTLPVAVVGEFKRGKSTLVNALLQTSVCPVDADIVTAVPTLVRYGDEPGAVVYRESADGEPVGEPMGLDAVADLVAESGNPQARRGVRSVEVRLRHRLLRSGLCLVDTPGVGGLDSAHGVATLGALDHAQGLLFVTDASQELTGPELDFLRRALERCPVAALVVTKTDLHPAWRRIVDLDREHLRRAGLELPVLPVSSFLRLRAARDPGLLEESGFRDLAAFLARSVVAAAQSRLAVDAAREVAFVTDQLSAPVHTEQEVLARPEQAARVRARLTAEERQAALAASPTATWQQVLSDGVQDLVADVEHDLHRRLRAVGREAEEIVDRVDPQDAWPELSSWLRREVVAVVVASHDELVRRAGELAEDVAQRFELDAGQPLALPVRDGRVERRLDDIDLAPPPRGPAGRLGTLLLAARGASLPPMVVFGVGGVVGSISLGLTLGALTPAVALGAGIGRKIIQEEAKRQLLARRQQAKGDLRRFLDEVAFLAGKDCRDELRRTQRLLRDEFQARAAALHRSTLTAMESVSRAATLDQEGRTRRASALAHQAAELERLRGQLREPGQARELLAAARA